MFDWKDLDFWKTGEWQVIEEHLSDLHKRHIVVNPDKKNMFKALDVTPFETVKVMICGQDPYPNHQLATGVAFEVPSDTKVLPPTLTSIFTELASDLGAAKRTSGDLSSWTRQGVLLWNVIPTCEEGKSLSHEAWTEYTLLTTAIIERLRDKGIVFVFLGGRARSYARLVHSANNCDVIELAHPAAKMYGRRLIKNPFSGSRMFSTINEKLNDMNLGTIDWSL